jgi:hypothetical protein
LNTKTLIPCEPCALQIIETQRSVNFIVKIPIFFSFLLDITGLKLNVYILEDSALAQLYLRIAIQGGGCSGLMMLY